MGKRRRGRPDLFLDNVMNRKLAPLLSGMLLTGLALLCPVGDSPRVFAALDDEEPAPVQDVVRDRFHFDVVRQIDAWLFGGNASEGLQQISAKLTVQVDEIDRAAGLTEAQKQKLLLAASGDLKRFLDDVADLRLKYAATSSDQNAMRQIAQEIQPLQKKSSGLFGDSSLFAKTLRTTLSEEQRKKYKAVIDARQRFRYQATVEAAMLRLQRLVPLRDEQRQAIVKLALEETRPPSEFGQFDYQVVIFQLAYLPQKKLRGLLDERQWQLLQTQLAEGRGYKQRLVQAGVLPKAEADPAAKKNAPPGDTKSKPAAGPQP
jgi:hypothetical protein